MKRKVVLLVPIILLVLFCVVMAFFACKKEAGNAILEKAGTSKENMIAWLSAQKEPGKSNVSIEEILRKAFWSEASSAIINNERQLLLVPLEAGGDLVLMINSRNAQVLLGFVAGTNPDGPMKNTSRAQLWADYFAEKKGSFSGSMRAASLQNEFLFEYHLLNGRQTSGKKLLPVELHNFNSGNITPVTTGAVCTDFYLVTSWSDGSETYEYMFSSCRASEWGCGLLQAFPGYGNVLVSYGGCNGGSGSVGGGGSKENNSSVKEIIDSLTNPCHKAVLQSLMANGLGNDITNILKSTFGVGEYVNVTFQDVVTLPNDPDIPAKTNPSFKGQYIDITTQLNNTVLANATKEYIAETFFHEILHGYLDANKMIKNALCQHIEMAQSYLDKEVNALMELFPKLTLHDAQCLVIGGYGDIQANNPDVMNAILTKYNLTDNNVSTTNNKYKYGQKGTKCQ